MTRATCSMARAASCLRTVAATLMANTMRSVLQPATCGLWLFNYSNFFLSLSVTSVHVAVTTGNTASGWFYRLSSFNVCSSSLISDAFCIIGWEISSGWRGVGSESYSYKYLLWIGLQLPIIFTVEVRLFYFFLILFHNSLFWMIKNIGKYPS